MISDLARIGTNLDVATGVCIVGAGIAGLLVATKLRAQGVPVVVLESGDQTATGVDHPLNRVVSLGRPYWGATKGRARCLGGTSVMWGGALIPFLPQDLEHRPHVGAPDWPVRLEHIAKHLGEAEALFGVGHDAYEKTLPTEICQRREASVYDDDFVARYAKWPRFRLRNVATLLKPSIEGDPDLKVWLNATVVGFDVSANASLNKIRALAPNGAALEVTAARFVLCAGAVESTRLLLLLDRQNGGLVRARSDALGRYFHDHVSLPVAELVARDLPKLNHMAAFHFAGSTMRSLRFELSPLAQAQEKCGSAFGHITFQTKEPSGFDVLRDVLKGLQNRGRVRPNDLARLAGHLPYLARASYWRFARRRLLWPSPASYHLHVVAEQLPRSDSRIDLASETDCNGCPLASIDWRVSQSEADTIGAFARRFDAFWNRRGLGDLAKIQWSVPLVREFTLSEESYSDIYHPGGTTRMGNNPSDSVVDGNLDCHAVPNLSIAATSIFASGASSNPTLMLMAFSLRLGERLACHWRNLSTPMRGAQGQVFRGVDLTRAVEAN